MILEHCRAHADVKPVPSSFHAIRTRALPFKPIVTKLSFVENKKIEKTGRLEYLDIDAISERQSDRILTYHSLYFKEEHHV